MKDIGPISSTEYGRLLSEVHNKTLSMGHLVEKRLIEVMQALNKRDMDLAGTIANSDYKVNKAELSIDEKCVSLLALYTPKARDLRLTVALIKVLVDIERIGDEVQRIADNLLSMNRHQVPEQMFVELDALGQRVITMLTGLLAAFANLESNVYQDVQVQDHKLDKKWRQTMDILTASLSASPDNVTSLLRVLWCARSLERIGDHIKNISEYIVFAVEGKDIRHVDNVSSA